MTYQKTISKTYQDEIEAFIAENGIKQLSNTDNKLGEKTSYRDRRKSLLDKKEKQWHMLKDALMTGDIVNAKTTGENTHSYIHKMRKAGWEIETMRGVGYRLIKAGGYVFG